MKFATFEAECLDWPADRLQAALTRDGARAVIEHLSVLSARAVWAVSQRSGMTPAVVVRECGDAIQAPDKPFSGLAWKRAQTLTLHRLGERMRTRGGPIDAVDLAGALALLYVLALMVFHKVETDAGNGPSSRGLGLSRRGRGKAPRRPGRR